jgi:hypothetical protein
MGRGWRGQEIAGRGSRLRAVLNGIKARRGPLPQLLLQVRFVLGERSLIVHSRQPRER